MRERTNILSGIHFHIRSLGGVTDTPSVLAFTYSPHCQPCYVRTACQHMIIAVDPVKGVRKRTDPPDMSFLPVQHMFLKTVVDWA